MIHASLPESVILGEPLTHTAAMGDTTRSHPANSLGIELTKKCNLKTKTTMKTLCMAACLQMLIMPRTALAQWAGGACSVNGAKGECIAIFNCPTILPVFNNKPLKPEAANLLRKLNCGFEGQTPLVCCADIKNLIAPTPPSVLTTTPYKVFRPHPPPPAAVPAQGTCGKNGQPDQVIMLNGQNAKIDEFPWLTVLGYRSRNGSRVFECGGVIISKRYILTAAHCIVAQAISVYGNLEIVRVGETDLDTELDCIRNDKYDDCAYPVQDIRVEETIPHPEYSGINRQHDIALLRLAKDIEFHYFAQPICLPGSTVSLDENQWLSVGGWGKTKNGKKSSKKLKQDLPVMSKAQCFDLDIWPPVAVKTTQICAGGRAPYDACAGSDGGPLMMLATGGWMVAGVLSLEAGCVQKNLPGVFTNVGAYASWIRETVF